jgi:hypothetical protein
MAVGRSTPVLIARGGGSAGGADRVVRALRLSPPPVGYPQEVTILSINVFNVTDRCQVCGGAANARYHGPGEAAVPHMSRKCADCGFTWEGRAVHRAL